MGKLGLFSKIKLRLMLSRGKADKPLLVTYDKSAEAFIWQLVEPAIKNRACPFCRRRLSIATFAGAFHYRGEPRLLHDSFPCLLEYAQSQKQVSGLVGNEQGASND